MLSEPMRLTEREDSSMNPFALGGVGVLVLALAVMFIRFGTPQTATRGGDARRSRSGRPRLD
jgi:hypothetical protein